jgi:choline-sulfatase
VRILYIDVDSLRPDHLSCYGYLRQTTPTIDALAQDGIRFEGVYVSDAPCLLTYHDGFLLLSPVLLFDLPSDPYQQRDLAPDRPDLVAEATTLLVEWQSQMMRTSPVNIDPMMTVLREGGPYQVRGRLGAYLARLRETGRAHHATALAQRYSAEVAGWIEG